MACPFFQPQRPLDAGGWAPAPRLPLGGAWAGFCTASPAGAFEPPEATQRDLCNCGYARHRCSYFPASGPSSASRSGAAGSGDEAVENPPSWPDAIRFSILSESPEGTRIVYILEKDQRPVGHGELLLERLLDPAEPAVFHPLAPQMAAQARAFAQSCFPSARKQATPAPIP